MSKEKGVAGKLGLFVVLGLLLLTAAIYFIGKQSSLFGSYAKLRVQFKTVNGLKVGNNVRFTGIDAGTVSEIELLTDTSVMVHILVKKKIQAFIKADARASISSDGLMGDKVLAIFPGSPLGAPVADNALLTSKASVEMEDVMSSMKTSVDNVGVITDQLAQFSYKINNGKGLLSKVVADEAFAGSLQKTLLNLQTSSNEFAQFTVQLNNGDGALQKLMNDPAFSNALDSTMRNLQTSSKGLSENMEAAKSNFLLRGYFRKKEKAEAKKKAAAAKLIKEKKRKADAVKAAAKDSLQ